MFCLQTPRAARIKALDGSLFNEAPSIPSDAAIAVVIAMPIEMTCPRQSRSDVLFPRSYQCCEENILVCANSLLLSSPGVFSKRNGGDG